MPNLCPRCKKRFKNESDVLNHMNQPYSRCRMRFEHLLNTSLRKRAHPTTTAQHSNVQPNPTESHSTAPDDSPLDDNEPRSPDTDTSSIRESDGDTRQDPSYYHILEYPGSAKVFGPGINFMDKFDQDQYASERREHLYYPFASRDEWEFASYLLRSSLSMAAIDKLLKLELIKGMGLSFRTAKDLRCRAEILPAGPQWSSRPMKTVYPTKNKIVLYYRDPLQCIQSLMHSPLVKDSIAFKPLQIFRTAEKVMRVYTEWLSGEAAWNMQSQIPAGATVLGTVLSSDKTNISAMTGNRQAHPLLISLANLDMDFRVKASNHAFLLLALLPIPQFIHPTKRLRGVLADRLFHECLDFITQPLKTAAQIGIMMSDALGWSTTIAQLQSIEARTDPWDLRAYFKDAQASFRLNGVHRPFWRDWPLSDPSDFLTPEPLHHWHKQFWDHDAKWCIKALGAPEIDFRFSVLHPHTGFRSFAQGISALKQVTGREHRDIQCYIIPVIADGVSKEFLTAIRSLMDFQYLSQAPEIDEATCLQIESSLREFHAHKDAIIAAGARCGDGNTPIDNWHIPKIEFLQSVVPNIQTNGVAIQWSADRTENAHITEVKDPARSSNNRGYEGQICRYLDRSEKCRMFDLATAVRDAGFDFRARFGNTSEMDNTDDAASTSSETFEDASTRFTRTSTLLESIDPVISLASSTAQNFTDYFARASWLLKHIPITTTPHRTFSVHQVAFHLQRDPRFKRMLIDEAATLFSLPDLRPALHDYMTRLNADLNSLHISTVGGRRVANQNCSLPFSHIETWTTLLIQGKAYHYPHHPISPQTVNAAPPSTDWPHGRFDVVIINTDSAKEWPSSGISGHQVVQLRAIFRVVPPNGPSGRWKHPLHADRFLGYVQRFDIVPQVNPKISGSSSLRGQYPDPAAGMYILKKAFRANGDPMGDIIPLQQIRSLVELTPRFGKKADRRFQRSNNLQYGNEYWLDKYFDKDLFYALNNVGI
ncbi:hypothetical protein HYPSUDRAFT_152210 [Hypholoma sublateritium FD-334 SS-4]|uniref:DUF6830 domain-containing protein n=1 Tax=Hypholoma sublateritium (strain FD-334 SS-4) TaxID=945553 RepID=A0A0D2N0X1_HYPSF|nr:hypothetical protein HYPSUDRAFT_152210 [Hypholoma sublateritium FD-334 SS-4]